MKHLILFIARKELKILHRQKSFGILLAIIILLLGFSLYAGQVAYKQKQAMVSKAQKERRAEWLNQGNKHPHIASHYGTYVFKQKTALSFFDSGLDNFTGTAAYLESLYPHEFMFRPVLEYGNMIRFGELSAALVLRLLLPLLLIFAIFSTFTKERETGTLKLLVGQGVDMRTIYLGKVTAFSFIVLLVTVPFFTLLYFLGLSENTATLPDFGLRSLSLFFLYTFYLLIIVQLSAWVSLRSSHARNSLLGLLIFWILSGIILPKMAANLGESLYPLPSMIAHKEAIKKDIANGMTPEETRTKRMEKLKQRYLKKYGVDSLKHLPISFSAVMQQGDEDYAGKVADIHTARLNGQMARQNGVGGLLGFVAPYIAVRNLSMAFTATDWYSTNDFEEKTETYKRDLVRAMHKDMELNTKGIGFYDYKPGRELWETVPEFTYQWPRLVQTIQHFKMEFLSLSLWLLLIVFLSVSPKKFCLS